MFVSEFMFVTPSSCINRSRIDVDEIKYTYRLDLTRPCVTQKLLLNT